MAHQINLYSPILLEPRRHFSAAAMAVSLALLAFGLAALAGWTWWRTDRLQADLASATPLHERERAALQAALGAGAKALPADTAALEQELAREQAARDQRRQRLAELGRGLAGDGQLPSSLLLLLAQTVPSPVWLDEVQYGDGRLEIRGHTLQTEALRPWIAALARSPFAAGQTLALLSVERAGATSAGAAPAWSFRIGPTAPPGAVLVGSVAPELAARSGATK